MFFAVDGRFLDPKNIKYITSMKKISPKPRFKNNSDIEYNYVIFFNLEVSTIIGVAINKEEYVPIITPKIKANINPLITSPPKIKMIRRTTIVVNEVFTVLLRVLFKALLTITFPSPTFVF